MTRPADQSQEGWGRRGYLAVMAVVVLAFVSGGSSSARGAGEVLAQLASLPLLAWAIFGLCAATGTGLRRAAVAVALLIVGIVVLEQLPLPEAVWRSLAVRDALARDLHVAGVVDVRHVWSLSPLASERGLWSIMPALAVFLGALMLPVAHHRRMLVVVMGLCAASVVLAMVQRGAPQGAPADRFFNPVTASGHPTFNGLFSNPNHQAIALAVSIVMIAALLLSDRWRDHEKAVSHWARLSLVTLAGVLLVSLPLTGSRAAFMLVVIGLVVVPVLLRSGRPRRAMATKSSRAVQWGLGVLALGIGMVVLGWLRFEAVEGVRWSAATATVAMGGTHAPLGAGVGSFVAWFNQAAPAALAQQSYFFNHAHNEYAQWWFESGVLGLVAMLAAGALLVACYPRQPVARTGGDRGVAMAAWLGCVLLLLHSGVDFPLRTPALMTVAALLAGIAVAQRSAQLQCVGCGNAPGTDAVAGIESGQLQATSRGDAPGEVAQGPGGRE